MTEDKFENRERLDSLRKDLIAWMNGKQEVEGELNLAQEKLKELMENELWNGPTPGYLERHTVLNERVKRLSHELGELEKKISHGRGAIWRTLNLMRREAIQTPHSDD